MKTIAIQEDDYGLNDASAMIWRRLLIEAGHKVRNVDVHRPDILEQLSGCDGFMWRWAHFDGMGRIARRLIPVIEHTLGIPVYPDQNTCWHYDDKVAQTYLLKAHSIPAPETWIWFEREGALEWAKNAKYPLVLKLSSGAGSTNVILVTNYVEAKIWIKRLFSYKVSSLSEIQFQPFLFRERLIAAKKMMLFGEKPLYCDDGLETQCGYVLFQEFIPDNDCDIRITVIGNRAFGYRRFNRPNDFRASGSGNFDTNPIMIDEKALELAFETAISLGSQSLAVDILKKQDHFVVSEVSYTFVNWMVHACPGFWNSELHWHAGPMRPEEAQLQDFLKRI